jgi:hypothetical protein
MYQHQLAWAAGFIDGEGCFHTVKNRRGKQRNYPCLVVSQRSPDDQPPVVLKRLKHHFKVGYINGPYRGNAYYYRVNGFEQVQAVIAYIWVYLAPVKREQAKRVLAAYHEVRN